MTAPSSDPLLKPLMTAAQMAKFSSIYTYQMPNVFTGTTTGAQEFDKNYDKEYEVTKIIKKHSKGYYYIISVSDKDDVFFQIYHGGWIAYLWHKLLGVPRPLECPIAGGAGPRAGDDRDNWNSVRKRTHLPATLGAAYLEIDDTIEAHKEVVEHDEYAKELLKTEPENLKMIEGLERLERLQEGDPEAATPGTGQPVVPLRWCPSPGTPPTSK